MIEKAKAGEVTRLPRPKNLGDETGTFGMIAGEMIKGMFRGK